MAEKSITEEVENGECCAICTMYFDDEYGYPKACEDCGGDGVLLVASHGE